VQEEHRSLGLWFHTRWFHKGVRCYLSLSQRISSVIGSARYCRESAGGNTTGSSLLPVVLPLGVFEKVRPGSLSLHSFIGLVFPQNITSEARMRLIFGILNLPSSL
jgi:hypothetical protein